MKIEVDDCGDIISPETDKKDQSLVDDIVEVLQSKHFLHEGWINYGFYHREAASFIVKLMKESGYKKISGVETGHESVSTEK